MNMLDVTNISKLKQINIRISQQLMLYESHQNFLEKPQRTESTRNLGMAAKNEQHQWKIKVQRRKV